MRKIPNLKASLAFKSRLAFCIGIHVTLLARVSPVKHQREVSRVGIPTEKARRDLNASDAVFLSFSDGENHLSIGSMHGSKIPTRVTQKSVPVGRVGRSVGRESCWLVGSLKLIKIIIIGRNSFVLRSRLNVKN